MTSHKKVLFYSLLILIVLSALFYFPLNIFSENNYSHKNTSMSSGADEDTETEKIIIPDNPIKPDKTDDKKSVYTKYLKDKSLLGFSPSVDLCQRVYNRIDRYYVNPVDSDKVYKGIKEELKVLLEDAGVDAKDINSLPNSREIFKKSVNLFGYKVNRDLVLYAVIRGMVKSLDDRYTEFFTPKEYNNFIKKTKAEKYGGIGIRISKPDKDSPLLIVEVFESGPAKQAGIKRGDKIIKVNGEEISGMNLQRIASMITGKENTKVRVSVARNSKILEFDITRKKIIVKAIHSRMLSNDVGYIKVDSFKEDVNREFRKAYNELEKKGMKALVLDLRNNPGGLVVSARELCGCFLPRESLISVFKHRNSEKRKIYSTGRRIVFVPVAVLVNKHSASSAEIVAAALKDHKAAVLFGTKTRGKGSVQRTRQMKGGCALKMTIEKFYSPNDHGINKIGIQPDFKKPMDIKKLGTDEDIQLQKALEYLKEKAGEEAAESK